MRHAGNCFTDANLTQMYQALLALQPPLDAPCEQQQIWDQLQRSLNKLGPCPLLRSSIGKDQLTAALSKMDVCHEMDVMLSACMAAAVIRRRVRQGPNVIVTLNLKTFTTSRTESTGLSVKQDNCLHPDALLLHASCASLCLARVMACADCQGQQHDGRTPHLEALLQM